MAAAAYEYGKNVALIREGRGKNKLMYGSPKGRFTDVKERARKLAMKLGSERLRISQTFVSNTLDNNQAGYLERLVGQMRSYGIRKTVSPGGKISYSMSGKGSGSNDDMVITLLMMSWAEEFCIDEKYAADRSI